MRIFVTAQNVPIGYLTPLFPLLYWPLGPDRPKFLNLFLYYSRDVWQFTVYWLLFFFVSAYALAGVASALNMEFKWHRANRAVRRRSKTVDWRPWVVILTYVLMGAVQGFVGGAAVGLLLLTIYRAGALAMSTWIPFGWGFAMLSYHICASYSTSLLLI